MRGLRPWLLAAIVFMAARPALAQGTVGRVSGTVRDDTGKPVGRATVTATNPDQAPSTLTAFTDDRGRFAILGLRRGTWTFTIDAPGFETSRSRADVSTNRQNPPIEVRLVRGRAPSSEPFATQTPADIQQRIDSAEASAAAGDPAAAIAAYRSLYRDVPALTTILLRVGALLEGTGDLKGALETYRQLQLLQPDNARARAAVERLSRTVP